jgi:predicted Zn-dependent protease
MSQFALCFSGHIGRYHKQMRVIALLTAAAILMAPRAWAQGLPDLGGPGDAALSPALERRIGESIVREIRARDGSYIDDPELAEYLGNLGARLTRVMAGARHDFEFFAVRDPSINAFALPGGFVGVHTGLVTSSETESELASVLAHEVAHVTQRHIARLFGQQQQMQIPMMVALAAALLLGRSRPDLASGAAAAVQAGMVQNQLNYSRDFEREADRVGLQALSTAGFDVSAMPAFFEKMQRSTRVVDDGTVPGYLRTHPITSERIADAQNKAAAAPHRQHLDSPEFQMVRAKLRAEVGDVREAIEHFEQSVGDKRYVSEPAARYGLASALYRARRFMEADAEIRRLRAAGAGGPMIETLAARVKQGLGEWASAAKILADARDRYPYSRPVLYAYVEALHVVSRNDEALATLGEALRLHSRDPRLHGLLAKTYALMGKRLLQHQAQAEVYVLWGTLPAAIEQLQLARSGGDGDFYQLSAVDARLKELRAQHAAELRDQKR